MKKKYKPSKKYHRECEAATGLDPNSRQPRILLCRKPGVWLYFGTEGGPVAKFGVILCDECCNEIEKQEKSRDDGTR